MDSQDSNSVWEDINPPMVSAQRHAQASPSSDHLRPASAEQFRNELVACLALVAPVGMTEEAKRDWLKVAWETLKHLPAAVLASSCRKARQSCDHPAKIVPAILQSSEQSLRHLREAAKWEADVSTPRLPPPDVCTPEQAREILKEFGLKSNPLGPDEAAA